MLALWLGVALAKEPVQTVQEVDLDRYAGTWYEVAAFPGKFLQKDCTADTLTWLPPRENGKMRVEHRCRFEEADGQVRVVKGRAKVVDAETNAKLRVTFGLFGRQYWIVGLDPEYQWALVGSPDRDHLWVLARDPRLDDGTYAQIVEQAKAQGYDVERLERTEQPADAPVMPAPAPDKPLAD